MAGTPFQLTPYLPERAENLEDLALEKMNRTLFYNIPMKPE